MRSFDLLFRILYVIKTNIASPLDIFRTLTTEINHRTLGGTGAKPHFKDDIHLPLKN